MKLCCTSCRRQRSQSTKASRKPADHAGAARPYRGGLGHSVPEGPRNQDFILCFWLVDVRQFLEMAVRQYAEIDGQGAWAVGVLL